MKSIILASTSPRRKEILTMADCSFETIPSGYEEDNTLPMPPSQLVMALARGKAEWVAQRHSDAVVIGADTLIALDGKVVGKPKNKADAAALLTAMSGRSHSIYSGFAIIEGDRAVVESVETKVFFRRLDAEEVTQYVMTDEWKDKAGGYGIQATAALFIEKIEGDYYTVVGLPLCRLAVRLKEFGIDLLVKQ